MSYKFLLRLSLFFSTFFSFQSSLFTSFSKTPFCDITMRLSNVGLVVAATYLWPTIRDEYQHMNFVCHLPTEVQTKTLNEQEFRDVLVQFGNCTAVERKRHSHSGGYVTLINATPYDWKLTSIVQDEGDSYFPPLIAAGWLTDVHTASSRLS